METKAFQKKPILAHIANKFPLYEDNKPTVATLLPLLQTFAGKTFSVIVAAEKVKSHIV